MVSFILLGNLSRFFNTSYVLIPVALLTITAVALALYFRKRWSHPRDALLEHYSFIAGLLLLCSSGWVLWFKPDGPLHSLCEGFFVAGAIIIFVDPFLKKRLLKEFARDLFPYMMGFELPLKIKERLRDTVSSTKLYRENMTMDLAFSTITNERVKISFKTGFDMVNPTSHPIQYTHHLAFEEAEQTRSLEVTLPGKEPKSISIPHPYHSGVYDYRSEPIGIEPNRKPESSRPNYPFKSKYTQEYPDMGFHLQTFGLPTIKFTLTLTDVPDDLEVTATIPEGQEAKRSVRNGESGVSPEVLVNVRDVKLNKEESIVYENVFMRGDSINIRWKAPKNVSRLAAKEDSVKA